MASYLFNYLTLFFFSFMLWHCWLLTRNFKFGLKLDYTVVEHRELHKCLRRSQEQAAGQYSETAESFPPHINLCLPSIFLKYYCIVIRILHVHLAATITVTDTAATEGCYATLGEHKIFSFPRQRTISVGVILRVTASTMLTVCLEFLCFRKGVIQNSVFLVYEQLMQHHPRRRNY